MREKTKDFGTPLNWFLFDCVFKPFAVSAVIILERWFSHRLGDSAHTNFYIENMKKARDAGVKQWGQGWAVETMCRLTSLWLLFCESDTAYKCWFIEFLKKR